MQDYFEQLSHTLFTHLSGQEILLCQFQGEISDFIRFNRNRVRQAGKVKQHYMDLTLITGQRQSQSRHSISGNAPQDTANLLNSITTLRDQLQYLAEDPYLYFSTNTVNSVECTNTQAPNAVHVMQQIMDLAAGMDLVGIFASGPIYRGFCNSLGQRNWHHVCGFQLDWSCYAHADKAVKLNYAGKLWQNEVLAEKLRHARSNLEYLRRPVKTIAAGRYRVYLAPSAVSDLMDMLSWAGFGLKSHRTAQSALLKMSQNGVCLNSKFNLLEDNTQSLTPRFTAEGFVKPHTVNLIDQGKLAQYLICARSAKEYQIEVNAEQEYPCALSLAAGQLAAEDILSKLNTGIYISNLWYCNFSDKHDCRITGMTRFACFWVQHGEIQAPISVMRFDDSVYRMFGDHLIDLGQQQELIFDSSSYVQRSTASYRLPGMLIEDFNFSF